MHGNLISTDEALRYAVIDAEVRAREFLSQPISSGTVTCIPGDLEIASAALAKKGNFVELCAWLYRTSGRTRGENPDFPLRGRIRLRSHISLSFSDPEIHAFDLADGRSTLWLNFLTLAGINGVLPLKLSEDIIAFRRRGGDSLHEFLDLINLRFWELFFQSYRIGTRPQYGFNNEEAKRLICDLAESYVGIDRMPILEDSISSAGFNVNLLRHCFHAGLGSGGQGSLQELLSQAVSTQVSVAEGGNCWVPVPQRYQSELGLLSPSPALGRFSILGRRARVRQLLVIGLLFPFAELCRFLPVAGGSALRVILSVLNIAMTGRLSLVAASYKVVFSEADTGLLGRPIFRLAWGAALGNAGAHTQFVQVSSVAITKMQGEK